MPFISIWIHAVWTTKCRVPSLDHSIRRLVFDHMIRNGIRKGILIDRINGYVDHAHMLVALKNTQSISNVIHLVKGESSHWINKNRLTREPFEWQTEYFAISVGKSHLNTLRQYIDRQEEHHRDQPYYREYKELKPSTYPYSGINS